MKSFPPQTFERQAAVEREAPLSFPQQRLWFLDRMRPGSSVYNLPLGFRLRGPLEPARVAACLSEIVRRQASLRTRFLDGENGPVQQILEAWPLPLPEIDLSGLPELDLRREERRLTAAEAVCPFDLARGPLLRTTLFRLGSQEWILVLAQHHIVTDGWSTGVLIRELSELYGASLAGQPSPLGPLPVQYADFAHWQRERLQGKRLERFLSYWRRELEGCQPLLELPTDRPRPALQGDRGGVEPLGLGVAAVSVLWRLARSGGASPFMVALAGFAVVLGRLAGTDDVVIGTPWAARTRVELEGLIGFFVNTLPLRVRLDGEPSFVALLDRVRSAAMGAYANGDLPFERLVEELAPERDLSRSPLFQVLFQLQLEGAQEMPRLGAVEMEGIQLSLDAAKLDVTLSLTEVAGGLEGLLGYSVDLFDGTTIRRLARQLESFYAAAASDPGRRIADLPLLSSAERAALVLEWNATASRYPSEESLVTLFLRQVEHAPQAVAVTAGGAALTYAELARDSAALALLLLAAGVKAEARVGLFCERGPGLVVGMLAILRAGGAYVPIDPSLPVERLRFLVEDSGVAVLLVDGQLAAKLPADGPPRIPVAELRSAPWLDGLSLPPVEGGDRLAYVIYTSGSTGRPKGVAVPHRAVVRLVVGTDYLPLGPGRRVAQVANSAFDAATFEVWGPLLNGGTIVILPQEAVLSPSGLAAALRTQRVQSMFLTTALFNQVAQALPSAFATLSDLLVGGEALDPAAIRRVLADRPPARLLNAYGPTENTTFSTWYEIARLGTEAGSVPIGRPIANSRCYALDPRFRPVPIGVVGNLYVGGDGLARGYLGRPDLTAERFLPDPFASVEAGTRGGRVYATGDQVRVRPDGALDFLGRSDQQVKLRGFRIELGEIEAVLSSHPEIAAAAVLARESGAAGLRLEAFLVRKGEAPDLDALRAYLLTKLPEYMVPSAFGWLAEMPITPNGKVDRRALAARELSSERSVAGVEPRTPLERLVAQIWCELLGLPLVGVTEDFFRLGGHSLLATQVVSRVRRQTGVELSIRAVFEHTTIETLAHYLGAELDRCGTGGRVGPPLLPRGKGGKERLPLSFAQQRLWFLERLQPGTATYNMPLGYQLSGSLEVAALEAAIGEVWRRHEALRTCFGSAGEEAVQVIAPALPLTLAQVDLTALLGQRAVAEAERIAAAEALHPFDLERDRLMRVLLVRTDASRWVWTLVLHHIVSDGWSIGRLLRELTILYRAAAAGEPSPLPEPTLQYADYALWQRAVLQGDELERQLSHWRARLAGAPPLLELPADRPRPAVQTFRGGAEPLGLDRGVSERLRELGRARGAAPFMVGLAAFLAFLQRTTQRRDLLVGTPIAGRSRAELEEIQGLFVNTLVLRNEVLEEWTFTELLDQVRETALEAYSYADLPFERLVEELVEERDLSRSPLLQILFSMQSDTLVELPNFDRVEVQPMALSLEAAKFDLTLALSDGAERLTGLLGFSRDLFDATTVRRMVDHLEVLLTGVAGRPESKLRELPFLSRAEEAALLVEWSRAAQLGAEGLPVHERFRCQALRRPQAVAVIQGRRSLAYGELEARSNRLAHALRRAGVGPEVPVAICSEQSLERVIAVVAVLKAGGAFLSLDPAYPPERLELMLIDSRAPVVLVEEGLRHHLPPSSSQGLVLHLGFEEVGEVEGEEGGRPPVVALAPENLAYLVYTSGSTGRPKAVATPHRGLSNLVDWFIFRYRLTESDRGSLVASPAFDVSIAELWPFLACGASLAVAEEESRLSAPKTVGWWGTDGVTLAFLPTPLGEAVLESPISGEMGLVVRELLVAGDRLHRRPLPGTPFALSNYYGPAEYSVASTEGPVPAAYELDAGAPPRSPSIGRPIRNTRILLLDRDQRAVPCGVAGELYVAGSGLARGYLHRPDLTAERFLPDPWGAVRGEPGARFYRTGDLVRWLPAGDLDFIGRADHQVKLRGMRVELGEIEVLLGQHPKVREAVVLALPDRVGGLRLVAYVAPEVSEAELRSALASQLPEYMVPTAFVGLARLPLTPNGKFDRQALAGIEVAPGADDPFVAPRTLFETLVAEIWAEVLAIERVGIHQTFWSLGGHSLLATRMLGRIKSALGADLPLQALFKAPTVAELTVLVGEALLEHEGLAGEGEESGAREDFGALS